MWQIVAPWFYKMPLEKNRNPEAYLYYLYGLEISDISVTILTICKSRRYLPVIEIREVLA
jgi:hypothetical protein